MKTLTDNRLLISSRCREHGAVRVPCLESEANLLIGCLITLYNKCCAHSEREVDTCEVIFTQVWREKNGFINSCEGLMPCGKHYFLLREFLPIEMVDGFPNYWYKVPNDGPQ